MNTKVRPALFVVGAIGFLCLGYAFAFGLQNDFSFSWTGNWEPVIVAVVGFALVTFATTLDIVLKHVGAVTRGKLFRETLRGLAIALLTFAQYAGVLLVMWGFILFLSFAKARMDFTTPVACLLIGVVANRAAALLLPYVRGKREKKETFVSTMEDDHDR
jgi:hypothetical protein